jgi:hypothetical protein
VTELEDLVQMLNSPTAGVRYEACLKLKHVSESSKQAVLALKAATRDTDPEVAAAARFALEADVRWSLLFPMDGSAPKPAAQAPRTPSRGARSPDSGASSPAETAQPMPGGRPVEDARRDWLGLPVDAAARERMGLPPEDGQQGLLAQVLRFPHGMSKGDIQRAIQPKEDDAASRLCCKCGQRPGSEYAFYYGSWLSMTDTLSGNVRTTQSQYVVRGRGTAFVCDRCITRKRRSRCLLAVAIPVLVVLAVIGLWATDSMLRRATGQGWDYDKLSQLLRVAFYAAAGGGFLGELALVVDLVGTPRYEVGQQIALDSQKGAIAGLGYRACWTERAYMKSH